MFIQSFYFFKIEIRTIEQNKIMELTRFCSLSLDAISPSLTREQSELELYNFMNAFPYDYVMYTIQMITETSDSQQHIKEIGATFLFRAIKTEKLLKSEESLKRFWDIFSCILPKVLMNSSVSFTAKSLMMYTLSALDLDEQNNKTNIVEKFIMELDQTPEFETFVLLSVTEILLDGKGFYGFPTDFLVKLIEKDLKYESSIVPRAQLFFVVSQNFPANESFINVFYQLLSTFPDNQLAKLLAAIDGFAEKHAIYFMDIIEDLVQYLCNIALNKDCEFRNLAMYIFGSLAQGAPIMCSSTPGFYQPVFQCLIAIMSEIDDDDPWEPDLNDVSSSSCAIDVFRNICKKSGCEQYFMFLNRYQEVFFRQNPMQYSWQQAYAVLLVFTELDSISISAIASKPDLIIVFSQRLLYFLRNPNTHPRIRAVIYKDISHLCLFSTNLFQTYAGEIILPILLNFQEEKHIEVQKCSAKALGYFFSCSFLNSFEKFFDIAYPRIKELLTQTNPELHIYLFECISCFANGLKSKFAKMLPDVEQIVKYYYPTAQTPQLKVAIINSFIGASMSYFQVTNSFPVEYVPLAQQFLTDVIQMKQNFHDESFDESCHQSILRLFFLLGDYSLNFVEVLLPQAIKIAKSDIPIKIIGTFEDTSDYPLSIYFRLLSKDQKIKVFVPKANVFEVQHQIETICAIAKSLKKNFIKYLETALEIANKWITYPYYSIFLIRCSWNLIGILLKIFFDEPNILNELLKFGFNSYLSLIPNIEGVQFMKIIYSYCTNLFKYANVTNWINQELYVEIFNTFTPSIFKIIDIKTKILDDLEKFQQLQKQQLETTEDADKNLSFCDSTLQMICEIIRSTISSYPEILLPIFEANILNSIPLFLENPITRIIGFHLITTYILAIGNNINNRSIVENGISRICEYALETIPTISDSALVQLIEIYKARIPFSEEFIVKLYNFYIELLSDQRMSNNQEMTSIADFGLASYTVFLENYLFEQNSPLLNQALEKFFEFLPVWEENPTIDYIFSFMARLFETSNPILFSNEENFISAIKDISSRLNIDMISNSTRQKLIKILKTYYNEPNCKYIFDRVKEQIVENKYDRLLYILENTPNI